MARCGKVWQGLASCIKVYQSVLKYGKSSLQGVSMCFKVSQGVSKFGKASMVWLDAIKQVLRGQKGLQNNKDLIKTKKMTCGLKKNHLIYINIWLVCVTRHTFSL